ncbi:MAG: hypothetical protein EZS28_004658 [Streblomastix strix]|uniref:Uncharacterized protein n=1 Tax=Streblomastix strix TaxID=222440 RepID=A0A5J4X041_9EUKA|nr:MAG: hypothetical protein EZS28_004658 [Streblomastix strix]
MQAQQCVGIPNPLTLKQQLDNILQSQCVGRETPLTLTNMEKERQCVRIVTSQTFPCNMKSQQCVEEILPQTLSNNQIDKIKLNNNVVNHLKNKCKMEQFIQESMYPPQINLSNIDLQYLNHQILLVDTTRLVSASQIGITIPNIRNQQDFTQQLFSDQQYQTSELPADIKFLLCQVNSAQINWPIGGRLIHFLDIWKLIKADVLITRGIKAYWINKQAPQIMELNMTVPNQRRSKESEMALGLLIQKELQEETMKEVSFNQFKWINPCFAIPKKDKGKQKKITDCSLLNQHLLSSHFIMEDIQCL